MVGGRGGGADAKNRIGLFHHIAFSNTKVLGIPLSISLFPHMLRSDDCFFWWRGSIPPNHHGWCATGRMENRRGTGERSGCAEGGYNNAASVDTVTELGGDFTLLSQLTGSTSGRQPRGGLLHTLGAQEMRHLPSFKVGYRGGDELWKGGTPKKYEYGRWVGYPSARDG